MSDTRVTLDLRPGDRVRALRDTFRGEVPAGSHGTFLRYESVPNPFGRHTGDRQTMAVVRFGCRLGETLISPNRLSYEIRTRQLPVCNDFHPVNTDAKASQLAQAHRDVAAAYDELARALAQLRSLETR